MADVVSVRWVQLQGETLKEIALPQNGGMERGGRGQTVSRGGAEHHQPFVSTHVPTAQSVQQISTSLTIRISRSLSRSLAQLLLLVPSTNKAQVVDPTDHCWR